MFTNRMLAIGRQFLTTNFLQNSLRMVALRPAVNKSHYAKVSPLEFIKQIDNSGVCKDVITTVNNKLDAKNEGRLFAVVQLCGKQFKVTAGDIIVVEGYWPPTTSDQIRLDKVLVAGGDDFSLIGRPILHDNLVDVQATVIEKTISHTRTNFKKKRRKQYMNIKFQRSANSMIRINSITVSGRLNEHKSDDGKVRLFD